MYPANARRAASPQAAFARSIPVSRGTPQAIPAPLLPCRWDFFFPLEGHKNTFLTGERRFNLSSHRRKARSSGLAVQSGPSPGAVPPREGGDSRGTIPGRAAHAAVALPGLRATPGASHGERSARGEKAGSSRGQAAIIINPTSVNVA